MPAKPNIFSSRKVIYHQRLCQLTIGQLGVFQAYSRHMNQATSRKILYYAATQMMVVCDFWKTWAIRIVQEIYPNDSFNDVSRKRSAYVYYPVAMKIPHINCLDLRLTYRCQGQIIGNLIYKKLRT